VLIWLEPKSLKEKSWNETDEKEKQEHGNTKTYKVVKLVLLARKSSGIVLILLRLKLLKEKRLEWDEWKGKTRTREHEDLQNGQVGVIGQEAIWNCSDLVKVQIPKRKKVGMRGMENKNKNTDTKTYK